MDDAERSEEQTGEECTGISDTVPLSSQADFSGLDEQKQALAELNDRYLRLAADFDNFKKRTARDREMITNLANERFAVDIIEVLDNFERAIKADDTHLREGIVQIQHLLSSQLQRHGITPLDALNKPFNPAEHEAIAHVPSEEKEGIVVDEVARGYRMHDKVIRYAKVAVSKGK
ncbi:MAG: nucleotide exchange factor GrpE [Methanoregula sp.]|nr:nucleotide exchange factor GrpE [Methanoregula sp.]